MAVFPFGINVLGRIEQMTHAGYAKVDFSSAPPHGGPCWIRGQGAQMLKRQNTMIGVTAAARREVYASFRAHTDEVRERLLAIIRDDKADNGHVIAAAKEILSRGWGAVPQYQVIEAMFQHQGGISPDALRQLPQEQLMQLEAMLARIVTPVEDAQVIDVTPAQAPSFPPGGSDT